MKTFYLSAAACILLAGGEVVARQTDDWQIGPVISGRNHSAGMPSRMTPAAAGATFEFPRSRNEGLVKYITRPVASLSGATSVRIRYRIEAEPGTRFVAHEHPDRPAIVSLYFQRRGDNWLAQGPYAGYRWYAASNNVLPVKPGTHQVTLRLNREDWKPVTRGGEGGFEEAVRNAGRVGFTFGSEGGRGHGVYATGPARFVLLEYRLQ